jgi:hypothetical protein
MLRRGKASPVSDCYLPSRLNFIVFDGFFAATFAPYCVALPSARPGAKFGV